MDDLKNIFLKSELFNDDNIISLFYDLPDQMKIKLLFDLGKLDDHISFPLFVNLLLQKTISITCAERIVEFLAFKVNRNPQLLEVLFEIAGTEFPNILSLIWHSCDIRNLIPTMLSIFAKINDLQLKKSLLNLTGEYQSEVTIKAIAEYVHTAERSQTQAAIELIKTIDSTEDIAAIIYKIETDSNQDLNHKEIL